MAQAPELLTFDRVVVGTEYPPVVYQVKPEVVNEWIDVIGDRNPLYLDEAYAKASSEGGLIAPPATWPLFIINAVLTSTVGRPPGGVHAKQELEFGEPVRPGDVLTTRVRIADKYVKRERKFVVQETVTTNQHGETVLVGRMLSMWAQ